MASLIFAQAKAIRKAAWKARTEAEKIGRNLQLTEEEIEEQKQIAYDTEIAIAKSDFKEILQIANELHNIYKELKNNEDHNWLFITIRPDPKLNITFNEFYDKVYKYIHRKFFLQYTLTFEQKGTSDNTLGEGFHIHIVADTKWRSTKDSLRDTLSTFNKICSGPGVEIKPTRNPKDIVEKYLTNYESDDNHKISTKEWDIKWRKSLGLEDLYTNEKPPHLLLSPSPGQQQNNIECIEISWD